MTSAIAVAMIVALFLAFPLIRRERGGGCGGSGCWKKKLGVGCGDCPVEDMPPKPSEEQR